MADLISRTPFEGLLPLSAAGVQASEFDPGAITSISPFSGKTDAVAKALKTAIGLPLPEIGRAEQQGDTTVAWTGLDQWFVMGPRIEALDGAALSDQSDAWACVALEGVAARAVLARLVPIDLRPDVFTVGAAARTLLGHMSCLLWRSGPDHYRVLVFRSMAGTAAHELDRAMRMVAARQDARDEQGA